MVVLEIIFVLAALIVGWGVGGHIAYQNGLADGKLAAKPVTPVKAVAKTKVTKKVVATVATSTPAKARKAPAKLKASKTKVRKTKATARRK